MEKIKRVMSVVLLVALLASVVPVSYAAQINEYGDVGTNSLPPYQETYLDQYSNRVFPSLTAAKNYYGWDYSYAPCSTYYNGNYYNYYYLFENNSRQYIMVSCLDDDVGIGVWGIESEREIN